MPYPLFVLIRCLCFNTNGRISPSHVFIIFKLGHIYNIFLILIFVKIGGNTADIVVSNSLDYDFVSLFCFSETVSTDRHKFFLAVLD